LVVGWYLCVALEIWDK